MLAILQKECKQILLDKRFLILTSLYVLIISLSLTIFANDYLRRLNNYSLNQSSNSDGFSAAKRPESLSIFAKGVDAKTARSFIIWPGGIRVNSNQESINLLFSLFTTPDLLYIFKVILSLFAILLTYDAVVGEKERGTLKLLLAHSTKRAEVILAKLTARYITFFLPLLLIVILGILILQIFTSISFTVNDLMKIGLFLVISCLYLLIFFSIGTLVSTMTRDSSVSLIISMLAWLVFVFVIPNSCSLIAKQLVHFPSAHYIEEQKNNIFVEASFIGADNQAENIMQRNHELSMDFNNKFNEYIKTFEDISRVSFVTNYVYLATDILNTGLMENRHLRDYVMRFQNQIVGKNFDKESESYFAYQRLSLANALQSNLFGVLFILLMNVALIVLVFYFFTYYDAR